MKNQITSFTGFKKDIIITFLAQIIIMVVAFGLNKILSTNLSISEFGEYNVLKRTASVISFLMLAGLAIAIPKYIAKYNQVEDSKNEARFVVAGLILMFSCSMLLICLVYIIKSSFSHLILGGPSFEIFVLPMLFYAFSLALTTFSYSYYRGKGEFLKSSLSQIFIQLFTLVAAFIFSEHLLWLLYTWAIGIGTYGLFICLRLFKKYYIQAEILGNKSEINPSLMKLVGFSLPRIPGEFILFAFPIVPLIIVSHNFDGVSSGFFASALSTTILITPLFSFVGLVLLPMVSRSLANNQLETAAEKINKLAVLYIAVGIFAVLIVVWFTPEIIIILYSSEYLPSAPIVRIIILSIIPNSIYLLLRNPIDAISSKPHNTINLFFSFLFMIVLLFMSSNLIQVSWAYVLTHIFLAVMSIFSWRKCLEKSMSFLKEAKH